MNRKTGKCDEDCTVHIALREVNEKRFTLKCSTPSKARRVLLKPQRKRDTKLEVRNSHIPNGKTSAKRLNTFPKVKLRSI